MRKDVPVPSRLLDYTECQICWALVAWNRYSHHLRWHERNNTTLQRLVVQVNEVANGLGFAADLIEQLVVKEEENDKPA
jgi:hypothetical protein